MAERHNITLAVTGASGSIYASEMLRALADDERVSRINFVPSESSLRVFAEELNLSGRNNLAEKLLCTPCHKLRQHTETDIGASIASGSYPTTAEIAAAQLDPTIPAQEAASNQAFNAAHHLHGETIIAFALRQIPSSPKP